ncbi:hypothetical protein EVAR_49128_1 [Eumeta japonica]|uniref:Uncharacterized protein n=1 Tax=Eumeta variegata TaxID=151549 RepID=A0A4C1YQE5_EUMVA|nr:hypothetical protein EVAR_49128_1 [Eumeta japonica]
MKSPVKTPALGPETRRPVRRRPPPDAPRKACAREEKQPEVRAYAAIAEIAVTKLEGDGKGNREREDKKEIFKSRTRSISELRIGKGAVFRMHS